MTSQDLLPRTTPAFPAFQAGLETSVRTLPSKECRYTLSCRIGSDQWNFTQTLMKNRTSSQSCYNRSTINEIIQETRAWKKILIGGHGMNGNSCILSCTDTCKQGFYPLYNLEASTEVNLVERSIRYDLFTENAFSARELNLEKILVYHNDKRNTPRMLAGLSAGRSTPLDYLRLIESHIPEKLISDEQFNEIKNISQMLSGGFTSFFGFETRLSDPGAHSDYLLAISSRKGEREQLMNLMQSEFFKHFQHSPQWQHISKFTEQWTNQDSIIHEKVLGLWFEFDSNDFSSTIPIPNVFLQTTPIQLKTPEDIKHCLWITKEALPLITGHQLPLTIQHKVLHCIQQLPEGAACIHVGIMLSRPTDGVRLVLNRIPTTQIVPYLKAIGWAHDTKELSSLLKELEKYTTRVVLHINVGKTIDSKIGLECSFSPDQFHLEEKWQSFFEYLTQKGLCLPEKKDAILQYPGMDSENLNDINFNSYMVATKIPGHSFSPALVRYISHVKITFQPGRPLDAKAYPGVRLFGHQQTIGNIETI